MDILETSNDSGKPIEDKFIISDIRGSQMDSDEEQPSVEHLAPQTLLETPESDVQFSLKSEGPMITYRVVQVQDHGDSPEFVSAGTTFPASTTIPQVIHTTSSNINGPIYVIGNGDTYTSTSGIRPIAPRPAVNDNQVLTIQVKKRDEKRRATHNEVERRRRDKINNWISKLARILPESPQDVKGNGHYDGHSKGGILAKAFEYIIELQATETRLGSYIKENKKLANAVEQLRSQNYTLEAENAALKELMKTHGIEVKTRPS